MEAFSIATIAKSQQPLKATNRQLQALLALTDVTLAPLDLDPMLGQLLDRVLEVMQVDNVALLFLDAESQTLRIRQARGLEEAMAAQVRVPVAQGFAGRIAATRQPVVVENFATFPVVNPFLREQLVSGVGVPVMIAERLLGVLHIGTTVPRHFGKADIRLLERVADRVGQAVERAQLREAEQHALRDAQDRVRELEAVFESVSDAVVVYDRAEQIVQANRALWQLLQVSSLDAYNHLSAPDQAARLRLSDREGHPIPSNETPLHRILQGGNLTETHDEVLVHTFDGRDIIMNIKGQALSDPAGQITGAVLSFHDVTKYHKLVQDHSTVQARATAKAQEVQRLTEANAAQSRLHAEELQAIFDSMNDGIIVTTANFQIMQANAAYAKILGISDMEMYRALTLAERAQRMLLRDQAGTPLTVDQMPMIRILRGETISNVLLRLRSFDGKDRTVSCNGVPMLDSKGRGLFGVMVIRDETAYRRLEEERQSDLAKALALQEVTDNMDRFLAMAAHDLRSPVTAISGNVELALRRYDKLRKLPRIQPLDLQRFGDLLFEAKTASDRLTRLVVRLFDLAQARTGNLTLTMEPTDLIMIVRDQLHLVRFTQPEHVFIDQFPDTPHVMILGDAIRLGQVTLNLLTNAVKYSPVAAEIVVAITLAEGEVTVSVQDHGQGIPVAAQSHLWEPFYRVPGAIAQAQARESLGLGLHICKHIIERHEGAIGVTSAVGQGSTFSFTLPLAASDIHE